MYTVAFIIAILLLCVNIFFSYALIVNEKFH